MTWDTTLYNPEDSSFERSSLIEEIIRRRIVSDIHALEEEYNEEGYSINIKEDLDDIEIRFFTHLLFRYMYKGSMLFEFLFQVFREHNEESYEIIVRMNHDDDYDADVSKLDMCDCIKCQHAIAIMQEVGDLPLALNCPDDDEIEIPENIQDFLDLYGGENEK